MAPKDSRKQPLASTSIRIPAGVDTLPTLCLAHNEQMEEVILPEGLKVIGDSAFALAKSLKEINLPEGLETICEGVLSERSRLHARFVGYYPSRCYSRKDTRQP